MHAYRTFALALAAAIAFTGAGWAQDAAPEPVEVIVTGTNYCLLCELSEEDVAAANETYGQLNALKVVELSAVDGTAIDGWAGKTLHYLPNANADELLTGNTDATVTVTGQLYEDASTLKVESFEEAGGEGEAAAGDDEEDLFGDWDDLPIGSMSSQPVL